MHGRQCRARARPGVATPRFNVFAFNIDPSAPVTITFDTPVVAYPGMPGGTSGPITSYAILAGADAKFTFRTSDSGLTGWACGSPTQGAPPRPSCI